MLDVSLDECEVSRENLPQKSENREKKLKFAETEVGRVKKKYLVNDIIFLCIHFSFIKN